MMTRDQLQEMKEDTLRTKVLIPLFEAMGFRDVCPYHGGILERGKDIVMWKETEIGNRENEAVVSGNLGQCYTSLGQTGHASVCFDRSLDIARDIQFRLMEAASLTNKGDLLTDVRQWAEAMQMYEDAIQVADEIGYAMR